MPFEKRIRQGLALTLLLIFAGVMINESLLHHHQVYFSDVEVETELSETDSEEGPQNKLLDFPFFEVLNHTTRVAYIVQARADQEQTSPKTSMDRAKMLAFLGRREMDS